MPFMVMHANGVPVFYSEDAHGPRKIPIYAEAQEGGEPAIIGYESNLETLIPPDAIEVTEGQREEFIANPGLRKWVDGQVEVYQPPAPAITGEDVNAERARRIAVGKVIDGVHVTGTDEDARNLTNLALAAQLRLAANDTATITVYRDGDNVDHELTPTQILSLWQQSAAYVSELYAASWALKALEPIPADYASDSYWPV